MSNALMPFAFGDNLVRVINDANGNPWFVAKDVCRVLGLENVTKALYGLDEDEKADLTISKVSSNGVEQMRTVNTISESGLYALAFHSRKPEARIFSKWVRAEVLPSLRKTGRYAMPGYRPKELPPETEAYMRSPLLTSRAVLGKVDFPNRLGVTVAFTCPKLVKRAVFLVSATDAPLWGVVTYWRNNVLMFVRLRRPSLAGERCFAFFCVQIPKQTMRCLMSSPTSLSAHELAQLQEIVREHSRQLALATLWLSELKSEVADLQNTIMPRSVAIPKRRRGKAVIIPFPSEVSHV